VPQVPVYGGRFGSREAERLLWRAGFGPRAGEARELASQGLERAVHSLTRPEQETLNFPPPADRWGDRLSRGDAPGNEVLQWVDRMVRSSQPLVQRMALIWEDWFAAGGPDPQGLGFVERLWSCFVPTPPCDRTRRGLERVYASSGRRLWPVVEAILMHPDLYEGEAMAKPPVVLIVGMLRARARRIDESSAAWVLELAGEGLLDSPNLSCWDESRWLENPGLRGRWTAVANAVGPDPVDPSDDTGVEGPRAAVDRALHHWGASRITRSTRWELEDFAQRVENAIAGSDDAATYRVLRQRALRVLVGTAPEMETC
jgi:hypothetical protein